MTGPPGKTWRRACAWCKQVTWMSKRQRYCSPSHARFGVAARRPEAERRAIASHAGRARANVVRARRLARVGAMVDERGLTAAEAYCLGYDAGYNAGWQKGCWDRSSHIDAQVDRRLRRA